MLADGFDDLIVRFFPIKVKLIRSLNQNNTLVFEFLTCWFTYIGCYLGSSNYIDGRISFPEGNEQGMIIGSVVSSLTAFLILLFIGNKTHERISTNELELTKISKSGVS